MTVRDRPAHTEQPRFAHSPVISFLLALAVLAPRFGYDSREYPSSAEEALSRRGFTWDSTVA